MTEAIIASRDQLHNNMVFGITVSWCHWLL